ncbi:MAG: TagF domain-containing protein [Pseudomonadota bacterium]
MGPGIFGKLPAHGDFVSRGLPAGLRKALDHWVTHQIGQRTLPADGLRARLTLGGMPVIAVILSSHDKPGRTFPIVGVATDPGASHEEIDVWCDQMTETLDQAVNGVMDADAVMTALPPAPMGPGCNAAQHGTFWQKGQAPRSTLELRATLSSD